MYRRLIGVFDHAAAFASCALVVALLVDVSLGAITRTLGDPLIWTDELARFLMVWLAVLGWIVASRKRLHVRIRFFQDLLPGRGQRSVERAIQIASESAGRVGRSRARKRSRFPARPEMFGIQLRISGSRPAGGIGAHGFHGSRYRCSRHGQYSPDGVISGEFASV